MAGDYHIYLHSESTGNGSGSNGTQPFSSRSNSSPKFSNEITGQQAFGTAKSIAQGGAFNMGVAALAKVVPWIAAVIAAVKITDHIISTGFAHQEEYTGHYKNNITYNNFKTHISNAIHPVRYLLSINHQRAQMDKQNKEITQQNRLIGNSILKDFNIGV